MTDQNQICNAKGASKIRLNRNFTQEIIPVAVFGTLWLVLVANLSQHWATIPEYSFGWFVPVLCAYLFLIRGRTRPPAELARSIVAKWIFWTAGIALLPTWLVVQPNPDWTLISWLLAFEVVALSLCAIYFAGGRSWLGHFAFSICFILVSAPWPAAVEASVIQGLTGAVTALSVAALNLFHIWAVQHGQLVEVKTGLVGIDEACSGIRSLQATLMLSLFFGELHRATMLRRVVLLLSGVLIAFLCNIGRTLSLVTVAAKDGIDAMTNWHDPIGFTVLAICFLFVWLLARLVLGPVPKFAPPSDASALTSIARKWSLGLGAWLLFTVVGTEVWYRSHETKENLRWSFVWPVHRREYAEVSFSKADADTLGFDQGRGASWANDDGSRWIVYFFNWAEGSPYSRIHARLHKPEICLPAAGYRLLEDRGTINVKAGNLPIDFHNLHFEYEGEGVYVFYCLWEARPKKSERAGIENEWERLFRLESVLCGERNLAQQVLEVIISGYDTPEKAEAALCREIGAMIEAAVTENPALKGRN
jgi:exosortase